MNPMDILKNLNLDDLKKKSEDVMKQMKEMYVTGESGGGFVRVTINGEFRILSIEYEDNDLIKSDLNTFRDLIIAAQNNAADKMREEIQKNLAGSMIPGMF